MPSGGSLIAEIVVAGRYSTKRLVVSVLSLQGLRLAIKKVYLEYGAVQSIEASSVGYDWLWLWVQAHASCAMRVCYRT